jgi:hypothetical protein
MATTFCRLTLSLTVFFLSTGFSNAAAFTSLVLSDAQVQQVEPTLNEEEMKQFLLKAKVISFKKTNKGVTRPSRLTLSNGQITHDAGFQSIDVRKNVETLDNGTVEINFRDSYHYNIAAYELAKLLGLGQMMPVTVERKWNGTQGSLSWWLKVRMDEKERINKHIHPPDVEAWNRQMFKKRVFAQLVYDSDPNLTNLLIGENWEIYMIDFSRAFRLRDDLEMTESIARCDRQLLGKLRALNADDIKRVTKNHLNAAEIHAVIKRRDRIVAHFEHLIALKGEDEVLY